MPGTGPADVVGKFNKAWAAGDIGAVMALVAEDAEYALHLSNDILPFGGVTTGRAAIEATIRQIRESFEFILYRPMQLAVEGDAVRYQVEFMYRHRASGEMLQGRFRLVMRVVNGLIVSAQEYHDRAKVEAFMRLVSQKQHE